MAPPEDFQNLFVNGNFLADDDDDNFRAPEEAGAMGPDRLNNNNNNNNNNNDNINNNNNNNGNNENGQSSSSNSQYCWIFGYGSLCWNPGFEFSKCITGYIRGYVRRFWQGNTTHRGTDSKPGRVATLVQEKEGITWGCAYRIVGNAALEYLKQRECTLGGYATLDTKFYPRVALHDTPPPFTGEAIQVHVYVAVSENNKLWMGPASPQQIAKEIVSSSGSSGHNVEYLLRLTKFLREEIPGSVDDHIFELEHYVMMELKATNTTVQSVMGTDPERIRRDSHENIQRPRSFEFTSRIPDTKLRCLNI